MQTVIVKDNYKEMSRETARMVACQILTNKRSVLGLPAGNTPIGTYEELVRLYEQGLVDFRNVVTFNVDEYYGISPEEEYSYHQYMRKHLFDHVNIQAENIHIPDGSTGDAIGTCQRYEEEICRHGGVDLQVLGLGLNGHIGFNEPGSDWNTTTRLVKLSQETRQREERRFEALVLVPNQAITMGIKTIMGARKVLLLACGKEKAKVVIATLEGPVTRKVPASILQLHPMLTVVLDKEAGGLMRRKVSMCRYLFL